MTSLKNLKKFELKKSEQKFIKGAGNNVCRDTCQSGCILGGAEGLSDVLACFSDCRSLCG